MARKCKEESERTYPLLLDAAEQVFSEKGYARATSHEIAEQAGLTRGAIYWHFSDKYQLLDAVLRRARFPWDSLPEEFSSLEQCPSPTDLGETFGRGLSSIVGDPSLHRVTLIMLLRTERLSDNYPVNGRLAAIHERIKNHVVAALSWQYRNADGSPHRNIPAAATAVKALLVGTVVGWLLNPADIELQHFSQVVEGLITSVVGSDAAPACQRCI